MKEQLAAIRARREAVTPGVWSASWAWGKSSEVYNAWAEAPFTSGTCLEDVAPQAEADAAFIAAAPADIDTLLAMVDALTSVWAQIVTIAEESTDSSTYISAYNMSRVRDVVRDWKEATVRR